MTEPRVACVACGASILEATAKRNLGLCSPCRTGTRESITKAREFEARIRVARATDPRRRLWLRLVTREPEAPPLSEDERIYFAVTLLEGEVYNGGFEQFFFNSSPTVHEDARLGLARLGADTAARLLDTARALVFPHGDVPLETAERRAILNSAPRSILEHLYSLDRAFDEVAADLLERRDRFAEQSGLIERAG